MSLEGAQKTLSSESDGEGMSNADSPAFGRSAIKVNEVYEDRETDRISSDTVEVDPGAVGLTKREYFAGLVMQGMVAHPSYRGEYAAYAKYAVAAADALLAELEKKP